MYRIHDIKFKGITPDLSEVFSIFESVPNSKKKESFIKNSKKLNSIKL